MALTGQDVADKISPSLIAAVPEWAMSFTGQEVADKCSPLWLQHWPNQPVPFITSQAVAEMFSPSLSAIVSKYPISLPDKKQQIFKLYLPIDM